MLQADFKRTKRKDADIQSRLRDKGIVCMSNKWVQWAKRYLNRSYRRKNKQAIKLSQKIY